MVGTWCASRGAPRPSLFLLRREILEHSLNRLVYLRLVLRGVVGHGVTPAAAPEHLVGLRFNDVDDERSGGHRGHGGRRHRRAVAPTPAAVRATAVESLNIHALV